MEKGLRVGVCGLLSTESCVSWSRIKAPLGSGGWLAHQVWSWAENFVKYNANDLTKRYVGKERYYVKTNHKTIGILLWDSISKLITVFN